MRRVWDDLLDDPRNPLHRVVVIQLAQDVFRQVQALRRPFLELHVGVAREVSPIALVSGRPILEHVLRLVWRVQHVVGAVDHAILVLDEERADLLGLLHHQVVDARRGIDGEVRVLVEPLGDLIDVHFHAAEVRAHDLQVRDAAAAGDRARRGWPPSSAIRGACRRTPPDGRCSSCSRGSSGSGAFQQESGSATCATTVL